MSRTILGLNCRYHCLKDFTMAKEQNEGESSHLVFIVRDTVINITNSWKDWPIG